MDGKPGRSGINTSNSDRIQLHGPAWRWFWRTLEVLWHP